MAIPDRHDYRPFAKSAAFRTIPFFAATTLLWRHRYLRVIEVSSTLDRISRGAAVIPTAGALIDDMQEP